ncbi:MAG: ABC transporter substrate-binding protein [Sphingomonadales bacterium]|nr:ABC transporter substrate-binding protein [Sphingomonadales bacterium]
MLNFKAAARVAGALLAIIAATLPAAAANVTVVDGGGRSIQVTDASRILSIGGDVTEILYALGAGDRIVAVDTTSQFPPEALREKQNVGYMRALSSEGVISVGATVVLASESSGPPEVVKTLKATSVPYVEVSDKSSAEGIVGKVRLIAKVVGAEAKGERLVQKVMDDFRLLAEWRARIDRPMRALFVLAVQNGRVMVGGKNTSADAILTLAGAKNVANDVNGFRPLPDEAIVALAPDAIVVMRRSSDKDGHDLSQLSALKGVQSTPAGAAKRIIAVDGLYTLGFGPRAPAAARDLMAQFYPDVIGKARAQSHDGCAPRARPNWE